MCITRHEAQGCDKLIPVSLKCDDDARQTLPPREYLRLHLCTSLGITNFFGKYTFVIIFLYCNDIKLARTVLSRYATGGYARWEARASVRGPTTGFFDGVQD